MLLKSPSGQWVNNTFEAWTKWSPFFQDIYKCIFLKIKFGILIQIPLKFFLKGQIENRQ